LALVLIATVIGPRFERFFGVELADVTTSEALLDDTTRRSDQGGSARSDSINIIREPWRYPEAAIAVLVRPFPWEAPNALGLLAALETIGLAGLALRHRRGLWLRLVSAGQNPYLAFSAIYSLGFIGAWSAIANFGILARQRTLVLPFVLIIICLPARSLSQRSVAARQDVNEQAISRKSSMRR
jgi:hypothetical protein